MPVHIRQVQSGTSRHAARGGKQRQTPPAPRVKCAAGHHGFDDLLHDQADEERHADLVDRECQRVREHEVRFRHRVGPDEGDGDSHRQREVQVYDAVQQGRDGTATAAMYRDAVRGEGLGFHRAVLESTGAR